AFESFGYKQLVFEPFFGGGIITAISIPFIMTVGPLPVLGAMTALFIFANATGLFYWGRKFGIDRSKYNGGTKALGNHMANRQAHLEAKHAAASVQQHKDLAPTATHK